MRNNIKDLERAKSCCFNALNEESNYSKAFSLLYSIAEAYFSRKQYEDAEELLIQILEYKQNRSDIAAFYLLGFVYENALMEKYRANRDQAQKYYEKAIKVTPIDSIDWSYRGTALQQVGNYAESIKAYSKSIELDKNYAYIWNNKAYALNRLGDSFQIEGKRDESIMAYKEAITTCDESIGLDPNNPVPWNNKGYALNRLGNYDKSFYDEAIVVIDKAIDLDPSFDTSWNNKAYAFNNLGKYEDAIMVLDKAIELNPRNANAWHMKGEALEALGKTDDANIAFNEATKLMFHSELLSE